MSTFLYHLPGVNENQINVKAVGLEYAFESSPVVGYNHDGFDGKGGAVIAQRDKLGPGRIKIDEEHQTWRKHGNVWLGFWNDDPPTPAGLRRSTQLKGRDVDMQDKLWHIPIARSFRLTGHTVEPTNQLARYFDVTEDGEVIYGDVLNKYQPLFQDAMRCWEDFVTANVSQEDLEEGEEMPETLLLVDGVKIAARAIGTNYRTSLVEVVMMKLLDDETERQVIETIYDLESFLLLQKKMLDSLPAESNSTTGESTAAPTARQLQTS